VTPLVRAAAALSLLSALSLATDRPARRVSVANGGSRAGAAEQGPLAPCPRGTLPDAGVCIPVPVLLRAAAGAPPASP
jgi:hypothetical protein